MIYHLFGAELHVDEIHSLDVRTFPVRKNDRFGQVVGFKEGPSKCDLVFKDGTSWRYSEFDRDPRWQAVKCDPLPKGRPM